MSILAAWCGAVLSTALGQAQPPSVLDSSGHADPSASKRGGFLFQFDASLQPRNDPTATDAHAVDIKSETYYLYVPQDYDGSKPYGLLGFINSRDDASIPEGWDRVLSEKRLLYIAAQKVGNVQKSSRRRSVTIAGLLKMMELYNIDAKRIYVAGFSGGARLASITGFRHPELISGAICDCGVDYCKIVPRKESTQTDAYGVFKCSQASIEQTRQCEKFALITGSEDFRRGNIRDIYSEGFVADGFRVKLWDIPNMGHQYCSASVLQEAVEFLESPTSNP